MNPQDREMRGLLAQLEIISAIPATRYDQGHGTDDDPGGRKPPGDSGYRAFAAWYGPPFHQMTAEHPGCRTIQEREACIEAARRELEHLRKGPGIKIAAESLDDSRKRMLRETEGWTLQDVSTSHWRVSVSMMRRLRATAGVDPETGLPLEMADLDGLDVASKARAYAGQGKTQRQIALLLKISQPTVHRILRRAA